MVPQQRVSTEHVPRPKIYQCNRGGISCIGFHFLHSTSWKQWSHVPDLRPSLDRSCRTADVPLFIRNVWHHLPTFMVHWSIDSLRKWSTNPRLASPYGLIILRRQWAHDDRVILLGARRILWIYDPREMQTLGFRRAKLLEYLLPRHIASTFGTSLHYFVQLDVFAPIILVL
jgi:hypothetical protein